MAKLLIFSLFATLLALFSSVNCGNNVEVHISHGPIIGETLELQRSQTVHRFLGIPYAEPPVGPLRFQRTRPLEKGWTEPLVANKWKAKCMQDVNHPWNTLADDDEGFEFNHQVSEDCLYLNIWTPKLEMDESKLRPVIMWIHGGALFMGTSAMAIYDGKTLAHMADAVVVTINYRLSTLGYLYSDKVEGVKGNQGLWDQAMALEWIQDNIRYFGGDPNKVTIIGESAGGWSVSALVLSPVTRNLFHNAFMMSGAVDDRVIAKPEDVVPMYLKGIRKVGCATEHETSITEEVMNCINKLEPAKIDQIVHLMYDEKLTFPPLLTVDGEFFTDLPFEMIKKGDFKTNINLIADSVDNEGSFMMFHFDQFDPKKPNPISLEQAKAFIGKMMNEHVTFKNKIDTDKLEKLYFNGLHPLDDEDLFRNRASTAYGDYLLNCPVGNFARAVKLHSGDRSSVFQMFYRVHTGMPKFLCSKWSGACHTDDIFSVFGLPFQTPEHYVNRERDVSAEVISFFSDFIRTGKPNKRMPQWQEYFLLDDKTVVAPYYELTNEATTHENFKFNLKHNECKFMTKHM